MTEEWRDIVEYKGIYQVSDKGRVRSLVRKDSLGHNRKSKVKRHCAHKQGYINIHLQKEGKATAHLMHRLVAKAFIPNPDNLPQVNHIDENKDNNTVENLEWCTNQYNSEYSKAKEYEILYPDGYLITVRNLKSFCRENSLHNGALYEVASSKRPHYKGYKVWKVNNDS